MAERDEGALVSFRLYACNEGLGPLYSGGGGQALFARRDGAAQARDSSFECHRLSIKATVYGEQLSITGASAEESISYLGRRGGGVIEASYNVIVSRRGTMSKYAFTASSVALYKV